MVKPLGTIIAAVSLFSGVIAVSPHAAQLMPGTEQFYVSLGYGPVISKINGFRIGVNDQTKWVFPYHKRQGVAEMHSENFFWSTETYPEFQFKKNSSSYKGAIGYSHRGMRLELEVDHVKFGIVPMGQQKQLRDGGILFALGKEITVASSRRPAKLAECLTKFSPKQVMAIAHYLKDPALVGEHTVARFEKRAKLLEHIAGHVLGMEVATTEDRKERYKAKIVRESAVLDIQIDNIEDVGAIMTRAIAMAVEGASVVELTAVSNTSVTANLCYDFPSTKITKFGLSPYACAGIGSSIVGVAEGHMNAQFSYKLKLGLDYNVTAKFMVYAGAVYSGIKGTEYDGIPVKRLIDDISHYSNSDSSTTSRFGYTAVGMEFGSRMIF